MPQFKSIGSPKSVAASRKVTGVSQASKALTFGQVTKVQTTSSEVCCFICEKMAHHMYECKMMKYGKRLHIEKGPDCDVTKSPQLIEEFVCSNIGAMLIVKRTYLTPRGLDKYNGCNTTSFKLLVLSEGKCVN